MTDSISVVDRGFAYGDGVFRTLRVQRQRATAWRYHLNRLKHDCDALGLTCPEDSVLQLEMRRVSLAERECAVKIMVTRGLGQRGYAAPRNPQASRIVMSAPLPAYPDQYAESGIRARLCSLRLGLQPALAGIKHLNRLENVVARREWDDPRIAEGILLDTEGSVIGGTMTNLFIVQDHGLATPDLTRCGVAGATRDRILSAAAARGMPCRVSVLRLNEILQADEVFVTNSLIGIWQVRQLADRSWGAGAVARQIRRWLDEEID